VNKFVFFLWRILNSNQGDTTTVSQIFLTNFLATLNDCAETKYFINASGKCERGISL
jgi:hypothetical protein